MLQQLLEQRLFDLRGEKRVDYSWQFDGWLVNRVILFDEQKKQDVQPISFDKVKQIG